MVSDGLEAGGPAASAVIDAGDFNSGAAHAIRNDVGRFWYHQLARARNAACRTELWVFRKQAFDTVENVQCDTFRGGRIMFGDVSAQGYEVMDGFGRPDERHTGFGKGRSLRVSQEATHWLTRAWAMPLPRSSDVSALFIPATCHSFVSR